MIQVEGAVYQPQGIKCHDSAGVLAASEWPEPLVEELMVDVADGIGVMVPAAAQVLLLGRLHRLHSPSSVVAALPSLPLTSPATGKKLGQRWY